MKTKILTSSAMAVVGYTTLFATRVYAACDLTSGAQGGADCAQGSSTPSQLLPQIRNLTNLLLLAIGVVSVVMIIIGGIRYAVSGGDEKGVSSAKDTILFAVSGLVVAVLSFAIVNFVLGRFK